MACTGTNIFSSGAGMVVALTTEAIPVSFTVDDDINTFNNLKAIVTSVGYNAQGGRQFTHSMREFIHVYVFTERVGQIVINGIAFPDSCEILGPQDETDRECPLGSQMTEWGTEGLEQIINWYECNRITTRASPIVISFGPTLFYNAFLVGIKCEVPDASAQLTQFSMQFEFIPNTIDGSDTCFSDEDFEIPSFGEDACLDPPCG